MYLFIKIKTLKLSLNISLLYKNKIAFLLKEEVYINSHNVENSFTNLLLKYE